LMEGMRVELKPHGIDVTIICPGWIRTPLAGMVPVPQDQMMDPAFAADRIVNAVRRRRAYYAFPTSMTNQVRLLKWLPTGVSDWLTRRAARKYQIQ
jgi:short-subunit dehydrogenase